MDEQTLRVLAHGFDRSERTDAGSYRFHGRAPDSESNAGTTARSQAAECRSSHPA
jgi:hypothetical protein